MKFNYSQLHYFDSKGREMPLVYDAPRLIFNNPRFESEYGEYLLVRKYIDTDDVYFKKTLTGKRFLSSDDVKCSLGSYSVNVPNTCCHFEEYTSTYKHRDSVTGETKNECYLSSFHETCVLELLKEKGFNVSDIPFPSLRFSTKLSFNKVSTGLVETESIYILAENGKKFTTVSDLLSAGDEDNFLKRYQLMFFIDCREQNNFRFFTTTDSDVTWSDRKFVDFSADNKYAIGDSISGFRVDVGFVGEHDGVYEDKMYVFLVDRTYATLDYPGDAYLIGEIKLLAETEGEDERYRTFFSNFGIPDPKDHYRAFADTDILEDSLDYMKINDYSKKMFLSYDQIFPYAGTYKALINTMKALGYNDILFKEWYKETGTNNKNNLVAYNILDQEKDSNVSSPVSRATRTTGNVQNDKQSVLNTISNASLEERVQLKKLNWISMLYKISQESSLPIDRFGFPGTEKVSNYYDNGTLVKLMSLKQYIDNHILGSNCRIIDVGGEGIVFERYNTYKYGSYQQVLEYNNEKSVALEIDNPHGIIDEGKAEITGKIVTTNSNISFEDFKTERFVDYCDGYIDTKSKKYNVYNTNTVIDNSDVIYCGKTLELNDNNVRFEVRSLGETESFRFGKTFVTQNSPSLIIDEGEIFFDPRELIKKYTNTAFLSDKLPIIQIKEGVIKSTNYHYEIYSEQINNNKVYTLYNGSNYITLNDVCTIVPPKFVEDGVIYPDDPNYNITVTDEEGLPVLDEYDKPITYYIGPVERCIKQPSTGKNISYVVNSNKIFPYTPNETYGLRYSDEGAYDLPQFRIIGYNFNEASYKHNVNLPDNELMLSIIEGKMIFDDVENNRKISIEFKPNENNTIVLSVKILQQQYVDGTYEFLESVDIEDEEGKPSKSIKTTPTLNTKSDYTPMVELYKAYKYDEAIIYNPDIKLTYNNTGSYKVNVMLYDLHNNVFSSTSKKNITISTPFLGTMMYTNEPESNGWVYYESTTSVYPENDNNVCIYRHEPKRQLENKLVRMQHHTLDRDMSNPVYHLLGCTSSRQDLYKENFGNTRLQSSDKKGRFAQISNTADKLSLIRIEKDSNSNKDILVFNKISDPGNGHVLKNTIVKAFDINSTQSIENMARLCLYNSLNETLYCSIDGYIESVSNESFFVFDDDNINIDYIKTLITNPYIEIYCVPCWYIETSLEFVSDKNRFSLNGNVMFSQNDTVKMCYSKGDNQPHGSCLVVMKSTLVNSIDASINNAFTTEENIVSHTEVNGINFYVSPIDDDYTSYIMKLSEESTVDIISGDNSRNSKKIAQHIGRGFTASVRDFDITIGHRWYENGLECFKDGVTYGHTGQIITDGFVAMKTGIPKGYYYAECRGIGDFDDQIEMMENEVFAVEHNKEGKSFRWRVYKQNKHSNSHELKVECFNIYPIFFIDEKGIYDVDVTLYDEYGNKFVKKSAAAITVI